MFLILFGLIALFLVVVSVWAMSLRRVVSTNEVHIIQNAKSTVSYGKGEDAGNVYYEWPSYLPLVGVSVIKLPVDVFDIELKNYPGYDSGRLPFILDLVAFFRITDSNLAAQRIGNINELHNQLTAILQGATRTILAGKTIEEIMTGRSEFGEAFTREVQDQLKSWGVSTVKNIELMDIRDSQDSRVIQNIMDKKRSEIEKESRLIVAENMRVAQNAEIDAQREIEINRQLAEQQIGIRRAEREKEVGIANEKTQQEINTQQKLTIQKQKEAESVERVKTAEINKEVNLVKAEEQRQAEIIKAEGQQKQTIVIAEGELRAQTLAAQGLLAEGTSKAEAEKLLLMAPVDAQVKLAKEIGENENYQKYLITIRQVEAQQAIGVEQAKSLEHAEIKVIANSGTVSGGISSLGDLFTSQGGISLGSALEGLAQSETGKALLDKVTGTQSIESKKG